MDIDLSILRMLEREKEISFDVLVEAIEQALLTAYHKTPGAEEHGARRARPQERPRHRVRRGARRRGQPGRGVRRHPRRASAGSPRRPRSRSCCSGCATPRTTSGTASSPARRATSISGVIQQGRNPDDVMVDLGKLEALLPLGERVPGENYVARQPDQVPRRLGPQGHARARRSRCRARTPTWSRSCSPSRCPRSPTAPSRSPRIAREAGHRTKIAVTSTAPGVNAKGSCIGPMGQRVRNVMTELHGEKIDIVDWSEDPAELVGPRALAGAGHQGRGRRRRGPVGARHRARLPALARDRQGGPERPPRRPAHRLAHRHPLRRTDSEA